MTIRNITDALAACQLTLPKSAAHWTTISDALRDYHDGQVAENPSDALETISAASAAETVARLTRQRLELDLSQVVARQLIEGANARAARAAQAEADSLIVKARRRFDAAAKVIAEYAAAYSPNDSHEDVLRRGVHAADVWFKITQATAELDAAAHLWCTLYERPTTVDAVIETYDGDHWRRVDAEQTFADASRWHALVALGYALRLNTYREAMALVAATPEKQLRAERVKVDGFAAIQQVRA
jgi:hypothetical protein